MFLSRAFPVFSKRVRLLEAAGWVGARRGLRYQEKPTTDSGSSTKISNITSIAFTSITSFSLGWWARGVARHGNTSQSQPSHEPETKTTLIVNIPHLPSSEKRRVMKDRESAEKLLRERYPTNEYTISLDTTTPAAYFPDPDSPPDQDNGLDQILTSPNVLYRVEKAGSGTAEGKGKTVALLLYAHPAARVVQPVLQGRVHELTQAMGENPAVMLYFTETI